MEAIKKHFNTIHGQLIGLAIDLVLLYIFASIAIDTASMFAYAAAIAFLITAILHVINIIKLSRRKPAHAKVKR